MADTENGNNSAGAQKESQERKDEPVQEQEQKQQYQEGCSSEPVSRGKRSIINVPKEHEEW